MQLTKKSARHIALALTQASTVLLSSHVAHAETTTTSSKESTTSPFSLSKIVEPGWKVDTAVLMYKEADSRVQAIEPSLRFEKDFGDQHILSGKVVID